MTKAPSPTKYKVGLVQMAMSPDPDANLKHAVAKAEEAAAAGAQLVCLPELFRSRYFAQTEDAGLFDLAEPVPGPSTDTLTQVAQRAGGRQRQLVQLQHQAGGAVEGQAAECLEQSRAHLAGQVQALRLKRSVLRIH